MGMSTLEREISKRREADVRELFSRLRFDDVPPLLSLHLKFSTRESHVFVGWRWRRVKEEKVMSRTFREGANLKLLGELSGLGRLNIFAHHRPTPFYRHSWVVGWSGRSRKLCENWQSDGKRRSIRNECAILLDQRSREENGMYADQAQMWRNDREISAFFISSVSHSSCIPRWISDAAKRET